MAMERFKNAFSVFFPKPTEENEEPALVWERTGREIKGSLFALIAIFQLISLISYLPIDSFSIFQGHWDHINNLGGIVGALFSEWFLGTLGAMGYFIVAITLSFSFLSFRGIPFKRHTLQFLGFILGTVLTSVLFHLIFTTKVPEASLMQGGVVGKVLGETLEHYLNTTGAILVLGCGFIVTLILTTHFSLSEGFSSLWNGDEKEEEETEEVEMIKPRAVAKPVVTAAPVAAPVPAKPSRKRKSKAKLDTENAADTATENSADPANPGEALPDAAASISTGDDNTFQEIIPFEGTYNAPSLRLLKSPSGQPKKLTRGEAKATAEKLVELLLSFQITGEIVAVSQGPVLTTYEFKPSAGMKLSKIAALQEDLGIVLGTRELRIIAPIPGKTVVGIEVPRPKSEMIALKDVLGEKEFQDKKHRLPFSLGKATDGVPVFGDMAALPHLLVAGSTGSGKSVFVNSLIMSFLYRMSPQELRLILVDPKMLELSVFDGLPHLITNVITDNAIAFKALSWAVIEMDRRYQLMSATGSKNIDSYNSKQRGANKLPFIVIVVDELADLMMSGGEEVEVAITRLAQKARAAGIHLVIATQRPSTDVVTGLIKANIPSRLAFKVTSGIDSRTILDTSGAEELIGRGDSLMIQPSVPLRRLHGCFVTEEELARTVKYIKNGKDYSKFYIQFKK